MIRSEGAALAGFDECENLVIPLHNGALNQSAEYTPWPLTGFPGICTRPERRSRKSCPRWTSSSRWWTPGFPSVVRIRWCLRCVAIPR
ncbi:doubtful CDS [Marinobacter nauticus ATCC 49840]|nr:doubtful CDS [Marinobacter nauticus ATCC 49840]